MPSTYLSLHYHLVFSTKNREPTTTDDWRSRLHDYLGGTIRGLGGFPDRVGGVEDHVHMLVGLKATHTLADVLRELKKASSSWARNEMRARDFAWQDGYAAFTVSPTSRPAIRNYIDNQQLHHGTHTYRDELIAMLRKAGVDFDPTYLV